MRTRSLALVVTLLGCSTPGSAPDADATVVVATWNVHHGRGLDDVVDVERIADELRAIDADVIALQEVDVGVARSGRIDIPAELAERLSMTPVFGKNIDHQGGDYGNAILSRFPVEEWQNHHYRMLREGEQRGLLSARLTTPQGPLVVMVTHLDFRPDDRERLSNVEEIAALTAEIEAPVVLCGDFNDLPGSPVHAALLADWTDAWVVAGVGDGATYPAAAAIKRIDWLLVRTGSELGPVAARVPTTAASDHRALVVELAR